MDKRPRFRKEWGAALGLALIVAALLLLPYLLGYIFTPAETAFTGLLVNVEDVTYLKAIEQGRNGSWTYRNFFTTEEHTAVFIEGFYLALGHLARLLGVTAVTMWHLSRWLVDLLFFILLYGYIARFIQSPGARFTAYAFALFGSGFDWFKFPLAFERANTIEAVPLDRFMPEAHIFFSALTYPHFMAGITFIMLTFWGATAALTQPKNAKRRWALFVGAGVGNLLIGVVYPFLIFLTAAALGFYYLVLARQARRMLWPELGGLVVAFIVPLPLFAYYAWAISTIEVFKLWNDQAVTLTPNPIHLLLAYAPYLVLGGLGLRRWRDWAIERQTAVAFLYIWIFAVAILLYAPVNPQRRFVEGLQIPLAIVAAIGWFEVVWPWILQSRPLQALLRRPRYSLSGMRRLMTALLVLLVSAMNIYIYVGTAVTLVAIQPYPFFRPQAELAAMDWLAAHTEQNDVVLASYWSGSYIPFRAGNTVFVGHRYETAQFHAKLALSEQFLAPDTTDSWRAQLLLDYEIEYLFYGRNEQQYGGLSPGQRPYFELAYENGETAVYRVATDRLPSIARQ